MEGTMEERIELYCRIYEQIIQRVSKSNLENTTEVALKIFEEVTLDLREEQAVKESSENNRMEKPATKRQREALHKFGIKKVLENLSMKEVSKILNRLITLSKGHDGTAVNRAVDELNRDWI